MVVVLALVGPAAVAAAGTSWKEDAGWSSDGQAVSGIDVARDLDPDSNAPLDCMRVGSSRHTAALAVAVQPATTEKARDR